MDKGTVVVVSAGNDAVSTTVDGWKQPLNYLGNADTATVGSPGTAKDALTVASYENSDITGPALEYSTTDGNGGQLLVYGTSEVNPADILKSPAGYEVVDCGVGRNLSEIPKDVDGNPLTEAELATLGWQNDITPEKVSGKIALIQKVSGTYRDKKIAAQAAGAIGVIFYNAEGNDSIVSTASIPGISIPCITLSYTNGTLLKSLIVKSLRVHFNGKISHNANVDKDDMSQYTSWGPTPSLDFKPEITAPGGDIYSLANNNSYQTMSGTSMSSPFTAGSEALITQAAKKRLGVTGRDLVEYAKNTTMNTAKVMMDKRYPGVPYSPRRQGAGMVQIKDAINNSVIVTDNNGKAAVALKSFNESSVTFTLMAKNYSSSDLQFNLLNDGVLHEVTDADGHIYEEKIGSSSATFSQNSITVPAKGLVKFDVTVSLAQSFGKQQFVEGFIKLTSADGNNPSLSVPFMGFYGDWSQLETVDKPLWDKASATASTSIDTLDLSNGTVIPCGIVGYDQYENPIVDSSKIAFSNGNYTIKPLIFPNLYLLRNAKQLKVQVLDDTRTKILRNLDIENNVRKNLLEEAVLYNTWGTPYLGGLWDGTFYNTTTGTTEPAAPGQYYIRVVTISDIAGAKEQTLDMPVKIDTNAPSVTVVSGSESPVLDYMLQWETTDDFSGADNLNFAVLVNGMEITKAEYATYKNDGKVSSVNIKLKSDALNTIQIAAVDYAGNIALESKEVSVGNVPAAPNVNINVNYETAEGQSVTYPLVDGFINGSHTLNLSGIAAVNVKELLINDEVVTLDENNAFNKSVTLNEGVNNLKVLAKGDGDIELFNHTYIVASDTTAPSIALSSPVLTSGYYYTDQASVDISGKVTEDNLSSVKVNGHKASLDVNGNFTFTLGVYGNQPVTITAEDAVGNKTEQNFVVVSQVPGVPLEVYFDELQSFMILGKRDVPENKVLNIKGSVTKKDIVFKIAGQDVAINEDLTFNAPVQLKDGSNNILVYAAERDGSVVINHAYKVLYDSELPKLVISEPVLQGDGKAYTNKDSVTLKGSVSDNTYGYMLNINGEAVMNVDRYPGLDNNLREFTYTVPMNASGTIAFELIDEFGNILNEKLEVVVDKVAPSLTLTPSVDANTLTKDDVMVTIAPNAEDRDTSLIEYSFDNKTWLTYKGPVQVVSNATVYARATDLAGNIGTAQLVVNNIDKQAPEIKVDGVSEGQFYNRDVTPIVTVSDEHSKTATLKLDGKDFKQGDAIVSEGIHKLEVFTEDLIGNTSYASVSFTIDKTAPVISIDGIEDGKEYSNKAEAKITSNEGTPVATLDGAPYNGGAVTTLGSHRLDVSVTDKAGNISETSIRFAVKAVISSDESSGSDLAKLISDSQDKEVNVTLDNTSTVSSSLFQSIAEDETLLGSDKKVTFTVKSGTTTLEFSFNVKDVDKNNIKDIDLSLNETAPNKNTIDKIEENAQILSFKENGVLPAPLTIRVKVDTNEVDITKPIYFYYYNPSTKKTELIAGPLTADKDGYVEVTITHCSDYFLTNSNNEAVTKAVENLPKLGSALDMNGLLVVGGLFMAIGGFFVIFDKKRRRQM